MAYISILSELTDADHAVTKYLMDTIRENLDDHETRLLAFGSQCLGHQGALLSGAPVQERAVAGVNVGAPPALKKWDLHFRVYAKHTGSTGAKVEANLYTSNSSSGEVAATPGGINAPQATLTASYAWYDLHIYLTQATQGRVALILRGTSGTVYAALGVLTLEMADE